VAPGATWRFVLLAARRAGEEGPRLLEITLDWLRQALTQLGIGAKTAAGYGRFAVPSSTALSPPAKPPVDLQCDYPSETTFRNRVLNRLNPGQLENLKHEIPLLRKEANREWRDRLKQTLAARQYRDIRKRLKSKDWFPQDWLPNQ